MKIGVYLCSCRKTGSIDLEEIKKSLKDSVERIETHDFLCGIDGQCYIIGEVRKFEVDTVLIAGCSRETKGDVFEKLCKEYKLNARLHFVNIREHSFWVHGKAESTRIAKSLLEREIARLKYAPRLREIEVRTGRGVVLVNCSADLALALSKHAKLALLYSPGSKIEFSELIPDAVIYNGCTLEVKGYIGNFEVRVEYDDFISDACIQCGLCKQVCDRGAVGQRHRYYIESKFCDRCGACAEICPIKAIDLQAGRKKIRIAAGQIFALNASLKPRDGIYTSYDALPELISKLDSFKKPEFISFEPRGCGIGRQGIEGCTLCSDICPNQCILLGKEIEFHSQGCNGCGACTEVCPLGLPQLASYTREQLQRELYAVLKQEKGILRKEMKNVLLLACDHHEQWLTSIGKIGVRYAPVIPFFLPESAISINLILAAIASGADGVAILSCDEHKKEAAMSFADRILNAFGLEKKVKIINRDRFAEEVDAFYASIDRIPHPNVTLTASGNARRYFVEILTALSSVFGKGELRIADELGFAEIAIDRNKCSFCDACGNLCPTGALKKEDMNGNISFNYVDCIACGICEKACPEKAISMSKIFDLSKLLCVAREVLAAPELVNCKMCGSPYISKAAHNRMMQVLKSQAAEGLSVTVQLELLGYCNRCRPKIAAVKAKEG
jgi:ferredoxin